MGQDSAAAGDEGEDSGDEEGGAAAAAAVGMPSKQEFYKATKQVGPLFSAFKARLHLLRQQTRAALPPPATPDPRLHSPRIPLSPEPQGTHSSKKKKQAKLQRVMAAVKKQARREAASVSEGFAAVHLLHDPQTFAERLFGRLQGSREKWEARTAMMSVVSR
jgi:hypothetical protein